MNAQRVMGDFGRSGAARRPEAGHSIMGLDIRVGASEGIVDQL